MRYVKSILVCFVLMCIAGAILQFIDFERAATDAARELPGIVQQQAQVTRQEVLDEVDKQATGIRRDLTGQIEGARKELLARSDKQLTALRNDVMENVAEIRTMADRRVGDSLDRVDSALAEIHGLREDVQPVLANATSLTANAAQVAGDVHEYIDENYYDLYAIPDTANVMLRAVAESAVQVGKASPAVADAVIKEANAITKPKHWYEKVFGPAFDILRLVAAFI
jgi:uncharacterized protein YoxC